MVFNEKYENNIVNWQGFFADSKSKRAQYMLFNNEHYMSLLIKMSPSESAIFPDLVLSISSNLYNQHKDLFENLNKGDGIDFKGTLVNLGNEFKMHHL